MNNLIDQMCEAFWNKFADPQGPWNKLSPAYQAVCRERMEAAVAALADGVTESMAAVARLELRKGGLLPAYTDEGGLGQRPILMTILQPAISAAIRWTLPK